MNIYVSKYVSNEKLLVLQKKIWLFEKLGVKLYFSNQEVEQDNIDKFDAYFLDYELNTTSNFIYEYEMLLINNKKILFLTDMYSPFQEFELTTMINLKTKKIKEELLRVFFKKDNINIAYNFGDKRWKWQDIQNLRYLKKKVRMENWKFHGLEFLDAVEGEFFTNAQYIAMQKLTELYVFRYKYVAFPLKYKPKYTDDIRDSKVQIGEIDLLNICYGNNRNNLIELAEKYVNIDEFLKYIPEKIDFTHKRILIGDELYFYDAFLNYFKYHEAKLFLPSIFLPKVNLEGGKYTALHGTIKIYGLNNIVEECANFYEPMTYTISEYDAAQKIVKLISKDECNMEILKILKEIRVGKKYTQEEYDVYTNFRNMHQNRSHCLFVAQKYIENNESDVIYFENRKINVLPLEKYPSYIEQKNKINSYVKNIIKKKNNINTQTYNKFHYRMGGNVIGHWRFRNGQWEYVRSHYRS